MSFNSNSTSSAANTNSDRIIYTFSPPSYQEAVLLPASQDSTDQARILRRLDDLEGRIVSPVGASRANTPSPYAPPVSTQQNRSLPATETVDYNAKSFKAIYKFIKVLQHMLHAAIVLVVFLLMINVFEINQQIQLYVSLALMTLIYLFFEISVCVHNRKGLFMIEMPAVFMLALVFLCIQISRSYFMCPGNNKS